ncbi:MAG: DUF2256 domain-containing protein [Planctomycetota bacterium]
MGHPKQKLPSKPCAQCGRDFSWRKKWRNCWDQVQYCSHRCKRAKSREGTIRVESK